MPLCLRQSNFSGLSLPPFSSRMENTTIAITCHFPFWGAQRYFKVSNETSETSHVFRAWELSWAEWGTGIGWDFAHMQTQYHTIMCWSLWLYSETIVFNMSPYHNKKEVYITFLSKPTEIRQRRDVALLSIELFPWYPDLLDTFDPDPPHPT